MPTLTQNVELDCAVCDRLCGLCICTYVSAVNGKRWQVLSEWVVWNKYATRTFRDHNPHPDLLIARNLNCQYISWWKCQVENEKFEAIISKKEKKTISIRMLSNDCAKLSNKIILPSERRQFGWILDESAHSAIMNGNGYVCDAPHLTCTAIKQMAIDQWAIYNNNKCVVQ